MDDRDDDDRTMRAICEPLSRAGLVARLSVDAGETRARLDWELASLAEGHFRELGNIRFIVPELLLVTHLLRPGTHAALAAVELIVSRRALGAFDIATAERWARKLGKEPALRRALDLADQLGE